MSDTAHSLLVNVIGSPRSGEVHDKDKYRRYESAIRTTTVMGGRLDARIARIIYEVGPVDKTTAALLAAPPVLVPRIDASYDSVSANAEGFAGFAKKYSNFSGSFARSSLAAVAYRLALSLAAHSLRGGVTSETIRGNEPARVMALGAHDTPVTSLTNTVFVPRVVDSNETQDTWAVLFAAICGSGSAVATDILSLDTATRQPIVPFVGANAIAPAIVQALQMVGRNMVADNVGPLFSFAVTKGIHTAVTVVGHTDEGGLTRDLLRCGVFSAPFGGINAAAPEYTGLPTLAASRPADIAGYVDSIALITAACVAHADPGQMFNGVWFPQTFTVSSSGGAFARPGVDDRLVGSAADLRGQIVAAVSGFAELYSRALATVFGVQGDHSQVVGFITSSSHFLPASPRHLDLVTASPWFWIEPTSLTPPSLIGSEAEANSSGSFAKVGVESVVPAFTGVSKAYAGDFTASGYVAHCPSARRIGALLHFWGHPMDGVGTIYPRQFDVSNVINPGAGPEGTPDDLQTRLEAQRPLSDYLWTRGQSPFPAPGEMMYLSDRMGFIIKHVKRLGFEMEEEHIYPQSEVESARITICAARPQGTDIGPSNWESSRARRARTAATAALQAARRRVFTFGTADTGVMAIMAAPPVANLREVDDRQDGGVGGAVRATAGPPRGGTLIPIGAPTPAALHHDAAKGPRVQEGRAPPAVSAPIPPGELSARPPAPPAGADSSAPPQPTTAPVPPARVITPLTTGITPAAASGMPTTATVSTSPPLTAASPPAAADPITTRPSGTSGPGPSGGPAPGK